jgi:hypothetical protein
MLQENLPTDFDASCLQRIHAKQGPGQFAASRADQARQTQHFAGTELDVHAVHMTIAKALGAQDKLAWLGGSASE